RYVREWLGAMVTGGIIECDGRRATYWLPREHAGSLTSGAGTGNLARLALAVGRYGAVEDRVVECFRTGGGVPAAAFGSGAAALLECAPGALELVARVPGLRERLED